MRGSRGPQDSRGSRGSRNPQNSRGAQGSRVPAAPIVLLHGLFGSGKNWKSVARLLSQEREVYTLDLRSHGDSPAGDLSCEALAGDLAEFIRDRGIERPVLLGHSLGGKTAMRYVRNYPDAASALIIADVTPFEIPDEVCRGLRSIGRAIVETAPGAAPGSTSGKADGAPAPRKDAEKADGAPAPRKDDEKAAGTPAPGKGVQKKDLADVSSRSEAEELIASRVGSKELARFLLQNAGRVPQDSDKTSGGFEWRRGTLLAAEGVDAACGPVLSRPQERGRDQETSEEQRENGVQEVNRKKGVEESALWHEPVLLLRGEKSLHFPEQDLEDFLALFPRAMERRIPGAEHWLHITHRNQFVEKVREFLVAGGF